MTPPGGEDEERPHLGRRGRNRANAGPGIGLRLRVRRPRVAVPQRYAVHEKKKKKEKKKRGNTLRSTWTTFGADARRWYRLLRVSTSPLPRTFYLRRTTATVPQRLLRTPTIRRRASRRDGTTPRPTEPRRKECSPREEKEVEEQNFLEPIGAEVANTRATGTVRGLCRPGLTILEVVRKHDTALSCTPRPAVFCAAETHGAKEPTVRNGRCEILVRFRRWPRVHVGYMSIISRQRPPGGPEPVLPVNGILTNDSGDKAK